MNKRKLEIANSIFLENKINYELENLYQVGLRETVIRYMKMLEIEKNSDQMKRIGNFPNKDIHEATNMM